MPGAMPQAEVDMAPSALTGRNLGHGLRYLTRLSAGCWKWQAGSPRDVSW